MATQPTLFPLAHDLHATDPHVEHQDKRRLAGQNLIILGLLKVKPRTNKELAAVSLKYTSRLSDLRAAGHRIVCDRLGGGLTEYRITESQE